MIAALQKTVKLAHVYKRKEIENYLLLPGPLTRAVESAIADRARRMGQTGTPPPDIAKLLTTITERHKDEVQGQYAGRRVEYLRSTGKDASTLVQEAIATFEQKWRNLDERLAIAPGKVVLAEFRQQIQEMCGVSLTDARIIAQCKPGEVPPDLRDFLSELEQFRLAAPS